MKTLKSIVVLFAIILSTALNALSQNGSTGSTPINAAGTGLTTNSGQRQFTDANKDGVCDNFQGRIRNGQGANFTDKDRDGICDHRLKRGQGKGNHFGCGTGNRFRHGNGPGNCNNGGNGYQRRHGQDNQQPAAPEPQKPSDKN
jgi:hypothetical protein